MKNLFILITTIGLLFNGCSSTNSVSKRNPHGIDKSRTVSPKTNGVKNGVEKAYYNDGSLAWSRPYVNGKKEGKEYYYSHDDHAKGTLATLWYTTDYKNGLIDGDQIYYFDTGEMNVHFKFKNGKENGKMVAYHKNGKLNQVAFYKNGKLDGPYKEFNQDGTHKLTFDYKNGRRTDVYDRHSFYQHQVETDCKEFFTPTSVVFDGGGKVIYGKSARNMWYQNHCGKYM